MSQIIILDPTSTEFNRGSFCYLPYILFSALKEQGKDVYLIEDFSIPQLDSILSTIEPSVPIYVAVWSYPQIDCALVLKRFVRNPILFFGYSPLIEALGLPMYHIDGEILELGLTTYSKYYNSFKHILLSDCDMHLSNYSGKVYPLFTSYGCPYDCVFCPSAVNSNKHRTILSLDSVKKIIKECGDSGICNIHFTDDDFFFDTNRTYEILKFICMLPHDFNLIALGRAVTVNRFIDKHGQQMLLNAGMRLIEIGLETAEKELARKIGKPVLNICKKLTEQCKNINILWLTITFLPGETIKSINETGVFMREHGLPVDKLYGRIRTNGTWAGLGQFFQLYHGTQSFEQTKQGGLILSQRPVRLLPSYIPASFLADKIRKVEIGPECMEWLRLYNMTDSAIATYIQATHQIKGKSIRTSLSLLKEHSWSEWFTFLAICARLGAVR